MAKILVVEDDIDLCATYADALEAAGHTVHCVYNGADAVDSLVRRRFVPDVVVLDLQLPGNSGIIILGVIRGLPRLQRTKVIIASGFSDTGQWSVSQWGADLFLQKPISLDLLKRTVDDFVSTLTNPKLSPATGQSTNTSIGPGDGRGAPAPDGT